MKPVDPFVAKVLGYLVDPIHAPHDEPLQVQLVRDPQVEITVQGEVPGNERAGRGSPVEGLEDRCLDLHEAVVVQKAPSPGDDACAGPEHFADVGVDRQVGVALAVACLAVGESGVGDSVAGTAVHLHLPEREWAQRLAEESEFLRMDGDLPHARAKQAPFDADPVSQIQQVEEGVKVLPDHVALEVDLDPARVVLQVREGTAAV